MISPTTKGRNMDDEFDNEGEIIAEFIMSWVNGGGRASDAMQAYHQHQAMAAGTWAPAEEDDDRPRYGDADYDYEGLLLWEMEQELY
jgi:hypothetical protein